MKNMLTFDDGPLVWIDLEMTGLNPSHDKIMEIAVLITNGNLELVDEGISYIIKVDEMSLSRMDDWCTQQHGLSGLTQQCRTSHHRLPDVAKKVLQYIQRRIPQQRVGVLAGNSVHVDKTFLSSQMPEVVKWLHYRIVDVSTIKELFRRWYPGAAGPSKSPGNVAHRALEDIKDSIRVITELQWYRQHLFVPPATLGPPPDTELLTNNDREGMNDTADTQGNTANA